MDNLPGGENIQDVESLSSVILNSILQFANLLDEKIPDRTAQIICIVSAVCLTLLLLAYWKSFAVEFAIVFALATVTYVYLRKMQVLFVLMAPPGSTFSLEHLPNHISNFIQNFESVAIIFSEMLFFSGVWGIVFYYLYFCLPVTFIPNFIPILGKLDDFVVSGLGFIGMICLASSIGIQLQYPQYGDSTGLLVYNMMLQIQDVVMGFVKADNKVEVLKVWGTYLFDLLDKYIGRIVG